MGTEVKVEGRELASAEQLANALRLERAKNKVLIDEVLGLEDELVNRQLEEYGELTAGESREFWRGQLLSNRVQAEAALKQLVGMRAASTVDGERGQRSEDRGRKDEGARPRPLHNRAVVRPVQPGANGAAASGAVDEARASQIRNRAHELKKAEGIPFPVAFRRAERELRGKAES